MAKMKIGLALGGGAARGWARIGVLHALADAGIVPDIVAGASMRPWSAAATSPSSSRTRSFRPRADPPQGIRLPRLQPHRLRPDQRPEAVHACSSRRSAIPPSSSSTSRSTAVTETEIGTGHEVWLSRGHLVNAMRASYALPGIFKPVNISNRWLFDGALVNPVPASVCRAMGARYVIAVNLNADMFGRGTSITNPGRVEAQSIRRRPSRPSRPAVVRRAGAPIARASCSARAKARPAFRR